jgi:2'-5' RNA ligase
MLTDPIRADPMQTDPVSADPMSTDPSRRSPMFSGLVRCDAAERSCRMVDRVRNHWYWRPGWRAGRSFYTWHITFENDPILSNLHTAYRPAVGSLPGITPVPAQWLHLTLQGVGFADKLTQEDLDPIVDAARRRLALIHPFEIRIGPATVDVESLQLPAQPVTRLRRLRAELRAAITDVWGRDAIPALPELEPHISLGYWNQAADTEPLKKRADALGGGIAKTQVTQASLINLNRDHHCYEWTTYAIVRLGVPSQL